MMSHNQCIASAVGGTLACLSYCRCLVTSTFTCCQLKCTYSEKYGDTSWHVLLQEYRTKKKMEHIMKAAVFGGKTISVVDPHRYAKRFQRFMEGLFVRK